MILGRQPPAGLGHQLSGEGESVVGVPPIGAGRLVTDGALPRRRSIAMDFEDTPQVGDLLGGQRRR